MRVDAARSEFLRFLLASVFLYFYSCRAEGRWLIACKRCAIATSFRTTNCCL